MMLGDPLFLLLLVPLLGVLLLVARRPPAAVDGASERVLGRLPPGSKGFVGRACNRSPLHEHLARERAASA